MKCERCEKNPARVRIDQVVNGKHEQHYLCQSCVDELMGAAMDQTSGFDGLNNAGSPFGFFGNAENMTNSAPANGGRHTTTAEQQAKHSKTPTLDQFGRDLTAEAREGKLDPAAGREREIRRVLDRAGSPPEEQSRADRRAGRRQDRHRRGHCPPHRRGQRCPPTCATRASSRSTWAAWSRARCSAASSRSASRPCSKRLRQNPEVILFIDELHTVVGAGAAEGAVGAGDLLKPALARGELRCIGATTLDEYRKHIEKDAALERRFQPVMVE